MMNTVAIDMNTAIKVVIYGVLISVLFLTDIAGDAPRKGTNLPCWIPSVSTRTLIPSADFGLEPGRYGEGNRCDRANGYLRACT